MEYKRRYQSEKGYNKEYVLRDNKKKNIQASILRTNEAILSGNYMMKNMKLLMGEHVASLNRN